jgi:hypothetical protein
VASDFSCAFKGILAFTVEPGEKAIPPYCKGVAAVAERTLSATIETKLFGITRILSEPPFRFGKIAFSDFESQHEEVPQCEIIATNLSKLS